MTSTFPVTLAHGEIELRPLRLRDRGEWQALRADNVAWLGPWEATSPVGSRPPKSFSVMVRNGNAEARRGRQLPLGIWSAERLVGQISMNPISWGSMQSGSIGYWVSRQMAGRGIVPTAVALLTDHAFFSMGLHRVEINIRPENGRSLGVVSKLGFRDEGVRRRFLHIDGEWRDHRAFALTIEDVPGGIMANLLAAQ